MDRIHISKSILFDYELFNRVQRLAEQQDRDFESQVRHMLRQQTEKQEDDIPQYLTCELPLLKKKGPEIGIRLPAEIKKSSICPTF